MWESLQTSLVTRTKDKIVSVRTAAVHALERLQGEEDDDLVVEELLRALKTDISKYVRTVHVAVLTSTGKSAKLSFRPFFLLPLQLKE